MVKSPALTAKPDLEDKIIEEIPPAEGSGATVETTIITDQRKKHSSRSTSPFQVITESARVRQASQGLTSSSSNSGAAAVDAGRDVPPAQHAAEADKRKNNEQYGPNMKGVKEAGGVQADAVGGAGTSDGPVCPPPEWGAGSASAVEGHVTRHGESGLHPKESPPAAGSDVTSSAVGKERPKSSAAGPVAPVNVDWSSGSVAGGVLVDGPVAPGTGTGSSGPSAGTGSGGAAAAWAALGGRPEGQDPAASSGEQRIEKEGHVASPRSSKRAVDDGKDKRDASPKRVMLENTPIISTQTHIAVHRFVTGC